MASLRQSWIRRKAVLFACCALLLGAGATRSEGSDKPFELRGNFRTLGAGVDNYNFPLIFHSDPADFVSQSLLRLSAGGRPLDWLSYDVHGVQSLGYSTSASSGSTSPFGLSTGDTRYRALDGTWNWLNHDHAQATLWLDRAWVKASLSWADVTVGRQAITFGKALFWNPLDVFLAFDPRQFDRDYKAGVDALRMDIPVGDFSGFNLIGVAGRTISALGTFEAGNKAAKADWFGSAMLARAFTDFQEFDLALQGGKIYGGYQIGGGGTGEVGPLEVRLEAAHLFAGGGPYLFLPTPLTPPPPPPTLRGRLVKSGTTVVAGVGHRFENTLHLQAEYFYNGLGDSQDLQASLIRFSSGGLLSMSEQLAGFSANYEILPILTGDLAAIVSFNDPSCQFAPRLTWSASDEIEFLAGALINVGKRPVSPVPGAILPRSEFGTYPDIYFVEGKIYF